MKSAIEISISVLAWLIALNQVRTIVLSQAWKTDPIAFRVWLASMFFALTLTFLIASLGQAINRLTYPNFSRLLAYTTVSMTLYLTASSFLVTFPTPQNQRQARYLKPYLVVTLIGLHIVYVFFVSRTPEWVDQPVPATAAEMIFKLVLFTYATVFCTIMAVACYRYLNQEKVIVTKYRIVTIILTATGGGTFFFSKTILALGYLWRPLGTEWLHTVSKLLMYGTAMLWFGSFLHNNVYARFLAFLRGIRSWSTYQDLVYLVEKLERLCPPVGMSMDKPGFWQFARNSDYHLYRAIVYILDSKTLIADFLADTIPIDRLRARWDNNGYQEAMRLNAVLQGIKSNADYLEMIAAYRLVGKKLMQSINRV
jgi:hypothetical protein